MYITTAPLRPIAEAEGRPASIVMSLTATVRGFLASFAFFSFFFFAGSIGGACIASLSVAPSSSTLSLMRSGVMRSGFSCTKGPAASQQSALA